MDQTRHTFKPKVCVHEADLKNGNYVLLLLIWENFFLFEKTLFFKKKTIVAKIKL